MSTSFTSDTKGKSMANAQIITVVIPSGQQQSVTLPRGMSALDLRLRENYALQIGDGSGEIAAGRYYTLPAGQTYSIRDLMLENDATLYVQPSDGTVNRTLEVFAWF